MIHDYSTPPRCGDIIFLRGEGSLLFLVAGKGAGVERGDGLRWCGALHLVEDIVYETWSNAEWRAVLRVGPFARRVDPAPPSRGWRIWRRRPLPYELTWELPEPALRWP